MPMVRGTKVIYVIATYIYAAAVNSQSFLHNVSVSARACSECYPRKCPPVCDTRKTPGRFCKPKSAKNASCCLIEFTLWNAKKQLFRLSDT
jgi:hypothetical protein